MPEDLPIVSKTHLSRINNIYNWQWQPNAAHRMTAGVINIRRLKDMMNNKARYTRYCLVSSKRYAPTDGSPIGAYRANAAMVKPPNECFWSGASNGVVAVLGTSTDRCVRLPALSFSLVFNSPKMYCYWARGTEQTNGSQHRLMPPYSRWGDGIKTSAIIKPIQWTVDL